MVNIHGIIGIVAGLISVLGYIPYIISIVAGKTKPDRATWFIWTLVGGLLAFSYLSAGDINAIWIPFSYFIGPFVIAIFSLRYGHARWSKLDTICMVIAILSLVPWLFANKATYTLLLNVAIDATGAIPTLVKTYRQPNTEDLTAWVLFFIGNTTELFAIQTWNLAATYPIYLFLLAATMIVLVARGRKTINP